jgi:hypothetical protein
MFQSVKDKEKRRALGEHYTSEENILKLIKPLFLDALWAEFAKIKALTSAAKKQRLAEFHEKIARLKFLDPACGCGNFLVVSYRELRLLEIEAIREILAGEHVLDVELLVKVNVSQFYGIEIEEFPAEIAQTAMWLMDHLMNRLVSETFGRYYVRIPLTASATIVNGNALTLDWASIVPPAELSYIMGNPPFLGKKEQTAAQKSELEGIFNIKGQGVLDYVTCWYKKAVQYIRGTEIECAFVSTNSICQGEQVPILWQNLMNQHGIKLNFAHQTFKWSNEARGKAAVHCVIVGFSIHDRQNKRLFLYETVKSEPKITEAQQINAYLIDAPVIFIKSRSKPLCAVSEMCYGSMPIDDGHLILSEAEAQTLIAEEPFTAELVRPYYGGDEFINNTKRFCLWFAGINPADIRKSKVVMDRIEKTRVFREKSNREATRRLAITPSLFGEIRQPDFDYLIIPKVSSENRKYIPIGFMNGRFITNGSALIVPQAGLYHFGILTSAMHMAWMRQVCGRMKSDYQYSASLVYNNFPWPPTPTDKQKAAIEIAAQAILYARTQFPNSSLADLYDPLSMPSVLAKAHQTLDKAVEAAYGRAFAADAERVAHLFALYQGLTADLFTEGKKKRRRK